jgi:hypothetical protein
MAFVGSGDMARNASRLPQGKRWTRFAIRWGAAPTQALSPSSSSATYAAN